MSATRCTEEIDFFNYSEFSVMLDFWIKDSNRLQSLLVKSCETCHLKSSIGEWHIHSMFPTEYKEHRIPWIERGFGEHRYIGKFRSDPCASGNYSWMDDAQVFSCVYASPQSDDKYGLVIFTLLP
uniref:Uncharacterized protein n=1 Tax=viral metagenome TaxID=1070528 RepID=A0A6C0B0I8_9ZZZZ